ncbi:hypothetical protein SLEP1_g15276 [Rubroshorea leprosula]|uniref:EF-hand domain-containing protein n=1 Tax=Rubroshorea leprosula TaxID=152421 RepID=A0AAV5ILU6_9ROSI|nr:hypothetical protein SLEP1_g15276 [Rubroshorea leprosula]
MEVAEDGGRSVSRVGSPSSSFRLRSPSLNSLRMHRIFDIFDRNGDGMITVDDLNQSLSLLGLEMDLSDLDLTVKSFVKSGNMGLKFDDFVELHQSLDETLLGFDSGEEVVTQSTLKMLQESDLTEAFKVFDKDGDGFISAQELQVVLGKLGFPEGREISEVEQMISSVDINKDGRVDFSEFKNMMQSVLIHSS